jgi:hypothetical protein
METFNIAERIRQVREIEARIEKEEKEFEAKQKPYKDWAVEARADILSYLNKTGQKSAATPNGTAYWKEKVTYRVTDKDEWRRHVVGEEAWELITWAAAPAQVEELVQADHAVPPGLLRNAVNILYVNAPAKPRKKVVGEAQGEAQEETKEVKEAAE